MRLSILFSFFLLTFSFHANAELHCSEDGISKFNFSYNNGDNRYVDNIKASTFITCENNSDTATPIKITLNDNKVNYISGSSKAADIKDGLIFNGYLSSIGLDGSKVQNRYKQSLEQELSHLVPPGRSTFKIETVFEKDMLNSTKRGHYYMGTPPSISLDSEIEGRVGIYSMNLPDVTQATSSCYLSENEMLIDLGNIPIYQSTFQPKLSILKRGDFIIKVQCDVESSIYFEVNAMAGIIDGVVQPTPSSTSENIGLILGFTNKEGKHNPVTGSGSQYWGKAQGSVWNNVAFDYALVPFASSIKPGSFQASFSVRMVHQ